MFLPGYLGRQTSFSLFSFDLYGTQSLYSRGCGDIVAHSERGELRAFLSVYIYSPRLSPDR